MPVWYVVWICPVTCDCCVSACQESTDTPGILFLSIYQCIQRNPSTFHQIRSSFHRTAGRQVVKCMWGKWFRSVLSPAIVVFRRVKSLLTHLEPSFFPFTNAHERIRPLSTRFHQHGECGIGSGCLAHKTPAFLDKS